ncbi:MAG TPA: MMPL family transporter, partial [Thermomicrobiales bacterium]|nr:MMPL family transporter [Thermomicrobiales bacterium]
ALLGLFVIGIPFIGFLGLGAAVAVGMSVLIALGLMPALLRLLGGPLDRFAFVPNRQRPVESTFGFKWVSRIQKLPAVWLVGALIVLGGLGSVALFGAQLGSSDAGTNPADSTTRKAYDLISQGFGPGANGPLLVVIENANGGKVDQASLDKLAVAFGSTSGVVAKPVAVPNPAGDTAIMTVIPTTSPQDTKTEDLIKDLRKNVIPPVADPNGLHVYIGGATATFADLSSTTSSRLPIFIALVAGLSVILLMAVFRSVLIPIKAAVVNLLSFFAGYGVLVAIFQKGFLGINDWLFGVDKLGPIESFLPVFLFSILFGLSMDYEIFLVSRVHEAWGHYHDNGKALRNGIGASGRVVLSAGAIMTCVFFAFTLGSQRSIKEIGLGLGSAILIDVLIVRMIVVPSFMSLAGNANWWFPAWLDRILPNLNVEGDTASTDHSDPTDGTTPKPVIATQS